MMPRPPSAGMIRALRRASLRSDGCLCPMPGVYASAEKKLLDALTQRGLITWTGPVPRINAAGRTAVDGARVTLSAAERRARLATEARGRRVREGLAKSPKYQAHIARAKAKKMAACIAYVASAEKRRHSKMFSKGRGLSAWEIICAAPAATATQ